MGNLFESGTLQTHTEIGPTHGKIAPPDFIYKNVLSHSCVVNVSHIHNGPAIDDLWKYGFNTVRYNSIRSSFCPPA